MIDSKEILKKINPPPDITTFEQAEQILANKDSITLCPTSIFLFTEKVIKTIIAENIPGDIMIAGVWRGGLAAYLQALLIEYQQDKRKLFLADTFNSFIDVSEEHPKDKKMLEYFTRLNPATGSKKEVEQLFTGLGLHLDNVIFMEGDIKETTVNFHSKLAVLIADMDFYYPTYHCLVNLYDHIAKRGYVFIDDYNVQEFECSDAVDKFIQENKIEVELKGINNAIYWCK